jgi:ketosteroid isomerase-like protein
VIAERGAMPHSGGDPVCSPATISPPRSPTIRTDTMPNEMTAAITACEERLRHAMLASDAIELDELIAPELIFTNHFGHLVCKDDDIALHRGGVLKFDTIAASELRIHADDALALVSVRTRMSGRFDGAPFAADLRFTRVWRRTPAGAWRIVAGHSCVIA